MAITLRNPHSIRAVLRTRPQDVYEIRPPTSANDAWTQVLDEARDVGIRLKQAGESDRRRQNDRERNAGGRSGGGEANVREKEAVDLEDIFAEEGGLRIAVEHVQDPRNLGSIFRTAAFFGVKGMVITRDRSAQLSDTVYDTASGGLEYVPFTIQTNLRRALEEAKKSGFWILGTSEHAQTDLTSISGDRRWLAVIGNEVSGLRRLTLETCDEVCRVSPASDEIQSLNVAVASAIVIQKLSQPA
jgi:23S rRNA (guanosine2251-2'-O)-methyltransferase